MRRWVTDVIAKFQVIGRKYEIYFGLHVQNRKKVKPK